MRNTNRVILIFFIPLFYFFASSVLLPQYTWPLTVLLTVVTLWFTELLPLPVTGLLVPCLIAITGLMPANAIFAAFGNEILFLFIGSFMLAAAMQKHNWDQRIALTVMTSRLGNKSLRMLTILVGLICFSLSMWISNTATCALMAPLCLGMAQSLAPLLNNAIDRKRLVSHLLLLCAYASSIGGIATPVGSPPNLLALNFLQKKEIYITFFDWLTFGLPIAAFMLIVALVLLQLLFPLPHVSMDQLQSGLLRKKSELGSLSVAELQVAGVFSMAVMFWILPGICQQLFTDPWLYHWLQTYLPIGSVAIFAAALLFVLPVKNDNDSSFNLTWEDAKHIDWGTILLFGGGLCLGAMLDHTGLAEALAHNLFPDSWSVFYFLLLLIATAIIMSEFSSNTASAAILIPIAYQLANTTNSSGLALVIAATLGASYGFMLPVSTPPNAIVYATGKIELREMIKTGILFDLFGVLIIAVFISWIF